MELELRADNDDRAAGVVDPLAGRFWRNRPCLPLSMSLRDLRR